MVSVVHAPGVYTRIGPSIDRTNARKRSYEIPTLRRITAEDIRKIGGGAPKPNRRVRVRFAPSPTGHLHIGGARTALVNYLFAKANGGDFLLRIEDTDHLRSMPESTDAIFEGLRWLGLEWDEEPIFQSQRAGLYLEKVEQLLASGRARRDEETGAVYFIMPKGGKLVVHDRVKGRVELDPEPDFVIQRADGSPTFLLANVVDDGEQGITHIFRGHEHLANAAKQIELFRALGYEVPEFYHLPLIHGDPTVDPDDPTKVKQGGKLSKRRGATSVIDYRMQGFSPRVLVNHLARLGMGFDTTETLSLEELAQQFDPKRLSKKSTPLGFDALAKRMFVEIMRMPTEDLAREIGSILGDRERMEAYLADPDLFARIGVTAEEAREALKDLSKGQLFALADGGKKRFSTFMDAIDFTAILRAPLRYDEKDAKVHATEEKRALMRKLMVELQRTSDWSLEGVGATLAAFNEKNRISFSSYQQSLRFMLSGDPHGFPIAHTMVLLGKEETMARLERMTAPNFGQECEAAA